MNSVDLHESERGLEVRCVAVHHRAQTMPDKVNRHGIARPEAQKQFRTQSLSFAWSSGRRCRWPPLFGTGRPVPGYDIRV